MSFLSRLLGPKRRVGSERRIVAHQAFGGAIRVFEVPTDQEWDYSEESREGDGFTVMSLKYVRDASPAPVALLAKIYTLGPGADGPNRPESLDWRALFGSLFSSIDSVTITKSDQLTMRSSMPAIEAIIDGTGADIEAPFRVRERRAVLANEEFIVTAFGPRALIDAFSPEIDTWFATVAFTPIGEANS